MLMKNMRLSLNDQINLFHKSQQLRQPLIGVMSALADERPSARYITVAAVLIIMAEELGRDVHHDFDKFQRMLKQTDDNHNETVGAMRDMVRAEMIEKEAR